MLKLTDAEWEVMKILWDSSELSLSQIVEELHKNEIKWVPNTVHTLITRLVKKNAIQIERDKTPFRYRTIIARKDCELSQLKDFTDRVFNGSLTKLVSTFLDSEKVSEEELKLLEEMIAKMKEEN